MKQELDRRDKRILVELQQDARISNQDLAKKVDLSPSPCWRRVQRLEHDGVIDRYVTLLNPEALGLEVMAFAQVSLKSHQRDVVMGFSNWVNDCPEVQECYAVSGGSDYLLKVRTRSMADYEDFLLNRLLQNVGVGQVSTSFVLSRRKFTTELPLD